MRTLVALLTDALLLLVLNRLLMVVVCVYPDAAPAYVRAVPDMVRYRRNKSTVFFTCSLFDMACA